MSSGGGALIVSAAVVAGFTQVERKGAVRGGVCGCGADPIDGGYAIERNLTRLGAPVFLASCCLSGTAVCFSSVFFHCTRVLLLMVAFPSSPSSPTARGGHPHLTSAVGNLRTPHHWG